MMKYCIQIWQNIMKEDSDSPMFGNSLIALTVPIPLSLSLYMYTNSPYLQKYTTTSNNNDNQATKPPPPFPEDTPRAGLDKVTNYISKSSCLNRPQEYWTNKCSNVFRELYLAQLWSHPERLFRPPVPS